MERAKALGPSDAATHALCADLATEDGDVVRARASLRQLLALVPDDVGAALRYACEGCGRATPRAI